MPPLPAPPVTPPQPCPVVQEQRPWSGAGLSPAGEGRGPVPLRPPALTAAQGSPPPSAPGDYRHRLATTPAGWPIRPHWCVWIEPVASSGPAALWDQRWWRAVSAAVSTWRQHLLIILVDDPRQAQVLVHRRRPPIRNHRASHGRAELQLLEVKRLQVWRLEPRVDLQISPGQAEPAMQATALHELGHAFGLWGHSDQPGDAMAVSPGPTPVLQLSPRDRATLRWLQAQPGLSSGGHPPEPPAPAPAPTAKGR